MKYVRYSGKDNIPTYGILEGEQIRRISGDLFGAYSVTDEYVAAAAVKLLPPCVPSKIVCVGVNYLSHILEAQQGLDPTAKIPKEPALFLKGVNCAAGIGDAIEYPTGVKRLDYEGEFTVVIGKKCKRVSAEESLEYVLGYTCGNDVSARDWQLGDPQWYRGKGLDGFAPIGPVISDEADPDNSYVRSYLNGKLVQDGNTNDLNFGVRALVSFISQWITLEAGDIIMTGTPSGVGPMHPGDVVEIEVENVGRLVNYIVGKE